MQEDELLVIEAGKTEGLYWRDLWRYRELFYFLAWRDLLVRYKQTTIGVTWAVIRPLLQMIVLTIIFGKVADLPSFDVPYPIIVFTGLLPWNFFANSLADTSQSLINNRNLISKIYFPRLIIPSSALVVGLADFLVAGVILATIMAWYEFMPSWRLVFLPFFLLFAMAAAIGAGLWVSALNVKYRDIRFIVPFVVQFGLYISPVGFSSKVIPDHWRLLYSANPMVAVLDGFRWAIIGGEYGIYVPGFLVSLALVALMLISGLLYFRRVERTFADII